MGSQAVSPSIPTSLSANMELIVQPAAVLGIRPSTVPGAAGTEVLIHWHDLPICEDSWEIFEVIQSQFPNFNLEDKVNAWVAGNDKPRIQVTYARRRKGKDSCYCFWVDGQFGLFIVSRSCWLGWGKEYIVGVSGGDIFFLAGK